MCADLGTALFCNFQRCIILGQLDVYQLGCLSPWPLLDGRSIGVLPAVQGGVGQLDCLCIVRVQQSLVAHVVAAEHHCWDCDDC